MTGKIDINTARVEEIAQLSGIERELAARLTEYRDSHGGLMGWEDVERLLGDPAIVERVQRHFVIERMDSPEAAV
jgi:DNA uptake protein ComE-like DNA-binding protein